MRSFRRRPAEGPGMYHVTIDPEGPGVLRLHLRRNLGAGTGLRRKPRNMLWINGTQLLLLEDSSADVVQALIEVACDMTTSGSEVSEETWRAVKRAAAGRVHRLYPRVPVSEIESDIDYIYGLVTELAKGACPSERGVEAYRMAEVEWHAPARMDLMISSMGGSGCQNACTWCYASDMPRVPELDTALWKQVLDRLWEAGIPEVDFTGGEPTLRPDLAELVRYAEKFVTGLITNGRALDKLAGPLRDVSLDCVQVSIESADGKTHDEAVGSKGAWEETVRGIRAAMGAGMYTSTNTTLTRRNAKGLPDLMRFLAGLGVRYVGCNALIPAGRGAGHPDALEPGELRKVLEEALSLAAELGLEFSWFTPTCYKELNPVDMGLGMKSCSACLTNMAIRPDGVVVPCQSWLHDEGLGNILTTPWKRIFNHPLARRIRGHGFAGERCHGCEYLAVCGGSCPLAEISPGRGEARAEGQAALKESKGGERR